MAVAAVVAGLSVALRLRDPHQGGWGFCPLRAAAGLDCPLCGGLRAVNDLTHGRVVDAAFSNLFFVASIPLLVGLWGYWAWRATRTDRRPPLVSGRTASVLVSAYGVLMVLFTVWRNTPWGHAFWA